ncbi:MAG: Asp-tRNA(Asn)/Glu-tRNA(Gln) amidotransferase subunit GatA [Candidatus Omnitrophica bacterium]|nr:Asp-tRNA(Asn)/Glu-tRNA(Gln) amidotransferase subunit GatA [Candidatus Omnitrophota bacterium]
MPITDCSAYEIRQKITAGELSAPEIAAAYIRKITAANQRFNIFVHFEPEEIMNRARRASHGPLHGIPLAVKDNLCVRGEPTTCASRILSGFRPPYNSTVIDRLEQAGALLLGKTNMDEFAFGSSCETSCYGPTANPWDRRCAPGGSSGGSAAAVAARFCPLALGSDTGGSIRQPASFCGVTGFKPTYGRISRYGLIAFASSLDQIGPFARDVRDTALLMNAMCGYDPADSTCAQQPVPDYLSGLDKDIRGLRIGIPREYFPPQLDPEVNALVRAALAVLEQQGVELIDIRLPHTEYAVAVYYIIAPSEASSNLARFDGVQYGLRAAAHGVSGQSLLDMYEQTRAQGFGCEAKRRIILGTYALSSGYYDAYYLKALKVRSLISRDFEQAFAHCDCIATPTSPTTAFRLGERLNDPLAMYLSDVFTISANLAGLPALSLPCGFSRALPAGLQLLGKPFAEELLLRIGHHYQQQTSWHTQSPPEA